MAKYDLADFYRNDKLSISEDDLSLRLASLAKLNRIFDEVLVCEILSSIFCLGKPSSDSKLVSLFKEDDITFSIVNNERELSVLSSFIVYKNHENDLRLHLSYLTCSLSGVLKSDSCSFLSTFLINSLPLINANLRRIECKEHKALVYPDQNYDGISLADDNDDSEITEFENSDIGEVLKEQRHYFKKYTSELNNLLLSLNDEVKFLKEESNFFWWVMRSYSDSYGMSFRELTPTQIMLASAYELSVITKTILGPASLDKIILRASKMGLTESDENDYTIGELVETCSNDFTPDGEVSKIIIRYPHLFPILFALYKKDEIGDELAWCKKYDLKNPIKSNVRIKPIDFSIGLYRELLLVKMFND